MESNNQSNEIEYIKTTSQPVTADPYLTKLIRKRNRLMNRWNKTGKEKISKKIQVLDNDIEEYRIWQEETTQILREELELNKKNEKIKPTTSEMAQLKEQELRARIIDEEERRTKKEAKELERAEKLLEKEKKHQENMKQRHNARMQMLYRDENADLFQEDIVYFYKNICLFSLYMVRDTKNLVRRIRKFIVRNYKQIRDNWNTNKNIWKTKLEYRINTITYPYRTVVAAVKGLINHQDEYGKELHRKQNYKNFFSRIRVPLDKIVTTFAPLLAIALFVSVLNYFNNMQFALSVEYCGEKLGYIENEEVYCQAREDMMDRMANEEYVISESNVPVFSLALVDKSTLIDAETLSDKMVQSSGNDIISADGVYVDDEFYGAIADGNEFLIYLDNILNSYRSGEEHETVQFVKNISVRSGVYPASSVVPLYQLKNMIDNVDERALKTYTVKSGDTLSSIAAKYDLTISEIREMNDFTSTTTIHTGDLLIVGRNEESGGLGIQVTRRETYQEDVPYSITYVDNALYPQGYTETISNGIPGKQWVTADVTYVDGEAVKVNVLSTSPISDPVAKKMLRGTMSVYVSGEDNVDGFIWPVLGGKGWFNGSIGSYSGHTGMDIAISVGNEVVASRGGYVQYATNISIWPYGKQVYIKHPDGTATRYAHLSLVTVQTGQYVTQGEIIGKSGNTGNSTGPHLHFEIWVGNQYMDPTKYIGYSG